MNYRDHALVLLNEWHLCEKTRPKHNAVDLRLEKDSCEQWAIYLNNTLAWGVDNDKDIAEACHQLESRLKVLKEKLVFEVLKYGV